jgi:hypothetical protein
MQFNFSKKINMRNTITLKNHNKAKRRLNENNPGTRHTAYFIFNN